jgi:hypothetical protein
MTGYDCARRQRSPSCAFMTCGIALRAN